WPSEIAQARLVDETRELEVERPAPRVRIQPRDRLGRILGDLLDLHAALGGQHQDVGPRVAVDREAEVDLAGDVERRLAVDERHLETLDVHADDLLRRVARLFGRLRELDAAGLAATADRHLGLDRDRPQLLDRGRGLVGRASDHAARDWYAERREHFFCLVLEELQGAETKLTDRQDHRAKPAIVRTNAIFGRGRCGDSPD